jgi:hypothetical protein
MKRPLVLIALLSLFLFAGCGSSNSASDTTQTQSGSGTTSSGADGFLSNQGAQIIYVQWTQSNGQFTGSWNSATLQGSTITYSNLPITGTYDSNSGSVNFVVNLGGQATPISGTVQSNTLALQMQQNGQTTNWTFHAASNLDYQTALSSFQQRYPGS